MMVNNIIVVMLFIIIVIIVVHGDIWWSMMVNGGEWWYTLINGINGDESLVINGIYSSLKAERENEWMNEMNEWN